MHFFHEHTSGAKIIFGLDWSPLIGGQAERLGQQRGRVMNATHYVLSGSSHGCAVGIVRVGHANKKNNLLMYSAAAIFSKSFPHGAQACLMTMKEGACWMLVCHAGVVLSHTDRWYADESQALEAIAPIHQRFPSLQIHRESISDGLTWPVWLNTALTEESVLKGIHYSRLGSNKWFYLTLLLLTASSATGYQFFYKRDRMTDVLPVSNEIVWRQALQEQSAHTFWHSYSQLNAVIDSWMKIPLSPMGWRLTRVQCESSRLDWQCSARFVRQHRLAMNSHLEQFKPLEWKAEFSPLEDASFMWRVAPGVATLVLDQPWRGMDWMSYLQGIGPAYEHILIGRTVLIPFKAPLDSTGQPLPRLSSFPVWTQRTLSLKGPLRSLTGLESFAMPVRWRRAVLNVERQAPQSINRSVLTFELTGDMFESNAQ